MKYVKIYRVFLYYQSMLLINVTSKMFKTLSKNANHGNILNNPKYTRKYTKQVEIRRSFVLHTAFDVKIPKILVLTSFCGYHD